MQWPVVAEEWPIVGRDAELELLGAVVADPRAPGAVVMGGAGVGKTRLGDEIAARADVPVIYVPATRAAATVPFGAFAPFLPADGLGEGDAYVRLRRAADALVAGVAEGERPIVYIDDAHLLDDASAALVLQLSLAGRVLLLLTVCAGEPQPDALIDLWKDNLVRLDLEPLGAPAAEQLLGAILGGMVDGRTAHESFRASGGNPLLLRELVIGLRQADHLVERSGVWRLTGPFGVPPRLAELVEIRLGRLRPEARDLFDVIALGEPISLGLIDRLGLLAELEDLQRSHLVRVLRDDRRIEVRLAHPLHADVTRDTLGETRRIRFLGHLMDWTRDHGSRRREDGRRLAIWSIDAGVAADPDAVLAAAGDAWAGYDLDQTVRLARLAAASGASARADHLHGLALDALGRHEMAEDVFAAGELRAATDEERALIAAARADNLYRGLARTADAAAVAGAAQHSTPDTDAERLLDAQVAVFALFDARFDDARARAEPLLEAEDDAVKALAGLSVAMSCQQQGHHDRAFEVATDALAARRRLDDRVHTAEVAVNANALVQAAVGLGRLDHACEVIEPVYRDTLRQGDRHGQAWAANALATLHLTTGRWREAERHARESAAVFGDLAHPGVHISGALCALASVIGGDVDGAERLLAELAERPEVSVPMVDLDVDRCRAWVAVGHGDLAAGVAALTTVADRARAEGRFGVEDVVRHDLVRLGARETHAARLVALADLVDGGLADARADMARGLIDLDGAQLDRAADAFAGLGALLFAAEAANEAAIAHRAANSSRAATASRRRAAAWARDCGDPRTPMLAQGTDSGLLTRREREIATLAAAGHSNREIAGMLVVSPRTIENHLQRTYEKLGISRRAELATALGNVEPPQV